MIVLRILIAGLVAFVPVPDGDGGLAGVSVLLRDSPRPWNQAGTCVEPHVPVLSWRGLECEDRTPYGGDDCTARVAYSYPYCDPERYPEPYEIAPDHELWVIDQEEITLELGGSSTPLEFDPAGLYIPTMRGIRFCSSDANPRCRLGDRFRGVDIAPGLGAAGRLTLSRGLFEAAHLVEFWRDRDAPGDDPVVYELGFGPDHLRWRKPAADLVVARIELPAGTPIRVTAQPLGQARISRQIELTPRDCGGGNLCADLFLTNQSLPYDTPDERQPSGHHFVRLFHFSKDVPPPAQRWMPTAIAPATIDQVDCHALRAHTGHADDPFCDFLQELAGLPEDTERPESLNNRPICPVGGY